MKTQDSRQRQPGPVLENPVKLLLERLPGKLRLLLHGDLVLSDNHRDGHRALQLRETTAQTGAHATAEGQEGVARPVALEPRRFERRWHIPVFR